MSGLSPSEVLNRLQTRTPCWSATLDQSLLYKFPPNTRVNTFQALVSANLLVGSDKDLRFVRHSMKFLLDSGSNTTLLPFDWAREREYDIEEIQNGKLEYLTSDQSVIENFPSEALLNDLVKEGRVIKAYRKQCFLRIGDSKEYSIPVLFCDGKVPPLLGREGVFSHFYFGMSAKLDLRGPQWQRTEFGDVSVWECDGLFPEDLTQQSASMPRVDVSFIKEGISKKSSMDFDSGAQISVYEKQKAESGLGIDFSAPPVYKRQGALVTRTLKTGDRQHFQTNRVEGPVKLVDIEISGEQITLWVLFPDAGPRLPPLLGCASFLEHYFVGFGGGPTMAVPVSEILSAP